MSKGRNEQNRQRRKKVPSAQLHKTRRSDASFDLANAEHDRITGGSRVITNEKPKGTESPQVATEQPDRDEWQRSAGYKLSSGKYKGRTLGDIGSTKEGLDYMNWLDGLLSSRKFTKGKARDMIRTYLELLPPPDRTPTSAVGVAEGGSPG
jgi:hypothetical protein